MEAEPSFHAFVEYSSAVGDPRMDALVFFSGFDHPKDSLLQCSVKMNAASIVEYMVTHFPELDTSVPLGLACRHTSGIACANILLKLGANPNLIENSGVTLIESLVCSNIDDHFSAIALLLKFGALVDGTTLEKAVTSGKRRVTNLLWCHGAQMSPEFARTVPQLSYMRFPATWNPALHMFFSCKFKNILKTVLLCWYRHARSFQQAKVTSQQQDRQLEEEQGAGIESWHVIGSVSAPIIHNILLLLSPCHFSH
ncbi:hypothetical protein Pelo_12350 [Pelomyxa schiedti]|nr:hypothetical protein Pelo_12350 [Pelomyxa schiedti]